MQDRTKSVEETKEMLGVDRSTVYNLLSKGDLSRAPSIKTGGRGRPVTRITISSIVNYIKTH